jgi:hypothetical protein
MGGFVDALGEVVVVTVGSSVCAGAWIAEADAVLTAAHCVATGGPVRVTLRDGERRKAKVIASSPATDLAWLSAGAPPGPGLSLGPVPLLGDPVSVIGHPFASQIPGGFLVGTLRYSTSIGTVSAIGDVALQLTAPINPGNSGGPVLDERGQVVGVVSRRIGGSDGVAFASRLDGALDLLASHRVPWATGTLEADVHVASWEGTGGLVSVGADLSLALHDTLVIRVGADLPLDARWSAIDGGRARYAAAELGVGPRLRLGTGPLTTRFELAGGAAWIAGFDRSEGTSVRPVGVLAPWAGGGVRIAGVGLDVGAFYAEEAWSWRLKASLSWPGTLTVF